MYIHFNTKILNPLYWTSHQLLSLKIYILGAGEMAHKPKELALTEDWVSSQHLPGSSQPPVILVSEDLMPLPDLHRYEAHGTHTYTQRKP